MFDMIHEWMQSVREAKRCTKPRSPHWPAVRRLWLADHAECRVCGTKKDLEVHHKLPLDWGGVELDPKNFMTACRTCHLTICHWHNWKSYNSNVEQWADRIRQEIKGRPEMK